MLNWQGATSIKITHVQDPNSYDASYDDPHLSAASEKYETLKIFLQEFGGSRYAARMTLRHPLFTLRQIYHMVKKI